MTERVRQLLYVVIVLGILAVIVVGTCLHTTQGEERDQSDPAPSSVQHQARNPPGARTGREHHDPHAGVGHP